MLKLIFFCQQLLYFNFLFPAAEMLLWMLLRNKWTSKLTRSWKLTQVITSTYQYLFLVKSLVKKWSFVSTINFKILQVMSWLKNSFCLNSILSRVWTDQNFPNQLLHHEATEEWQRPPPKIGLILLPEKHIT